MLGTGTNWIGDVKVYWGEIEPERGQRDWEYVDYYTNQESLNTILELRSYSPWASVGGDCGKFWRTRISTPLKSEFEEDDYASFLFDLVSRSKDRIKYWSVENEMEMESFWCCEACASSQESAAEFVRLLKTSSESIKRADPTAVIILGGFTGGFNGDEPINAEFVEYVLAEGRDYFDVLDIHLYREHETFDERVKWFEDEMGKNGYSKPIWSTELGGPDIRSCFTDSDWGNVVDLIVNKDYAQLEMVMQENDCARTFYFPEYNEAYYQLHAEELIKRYVLGIDAGISKIFWWHLYARDNYDKEPPFPQQLIFERMGLVAVNYDSLDPITLTTDDYFLTPAYHTYGIMAEKLTGFESVEKIAEGQYKFTVKGQPVVVAWSDTGAETIDLSDHFASSHVRVTHIVTALDANEAPVYLQDEVWPVDSIAITQTPIFIKGGGEVSLPLVMRSY